MPSSGELTRTVANAGSYSGAVCLADEVRALAEGADGRAGDGQACPG
jgi:hypothetical protein